MLGRIENSSRVHTVKEKVFGLDIRIIILQEGHRSKGFIHCLVGTFGLLYNEQSLRSLLMTLR